MYFLSHTSEMCYNFQFDVKLVIIMRYVFEVYVHLNPMLMFAALPYQHNRVIYVCILGSISSMHILLCSLSWTFKIVISSYSAAPPASGSPISSASSFFGLPPQSLDLQPHIRWHIPDCLRMNSFYFGRSTTINATTRTHTDNL